MPVKYIVNPLTGQLDAIGDFQNDSGNLLIERKTLSTTDISNKYITLEIEPSEPEETKFDVVGGITQNYGDDFIVDGSLVKWEGLFLDGVLEEGDTVIITYS